MKTIPKDVKDKVIRLRQEGMSFAGIAEQVTKEGFKLSRPTVARLCPKADDAKGEVPNKAGVGISARIQGDLDDALETAKDAIQGISELLDNPLTRDAVLKELEESGLMTGERVDQFVCEEEAKRERLQKENDYLRQRLCILGGAQNENTRLQGELAAALKEIERLKGIERNLRAELMERERTPSMKDMAMAVLMKRILESG